MADVETVETVESPEVGGPIVMKNAAQQIAYAAVLVPGEPDSDGEILTADKIEQVAHGWMESYRNVDLMHTLNNTGAPVESYILPAAMEVTAYGEKVMLPQGSWILASKLSNEAWAGVESGILSGYSVMGIRKAHLDAAVKSESLDELAFKRTLLADLGEDWVAAFVSVVDHPAVPKAKFFALKAKEMPEPPTFFAKLGKVLGISRADKVGRKYSDSTYTSLQSAYESIGVLLKDAEAERVAKAQEGVNEMTDEELQGAINEAVKAATAPLIERLAVLETVDKSAEVVEEVVAEVVEADAADATKSEDEVVADEVVVDPFRDEVEKRLAQLEKRPRSSSKALDNEGVPAVQEEVYDKFERDFFGRRVHSA